MSFTLAPTSYVDHTLGAFPNQESMTSKDDASSTTSAAGLMMMNKLPLTYCEDDQQSLFMPLVPRACASKNWFVTAAGQKPIFPSFMVSQSSKDADKGFDEILHISSNILNDFDFSSFNFQEDSADNSKRTEDYNDDPLMYPVFPVDKGLTSFCALDSIGDYFSTSTVQTQEEHVNEVVLANNDESENYEDWETPLMLNARESFHITPEHGTTLSSSGPFTSVTISGGSTCSDSSNIVKAEPSTQKDKWMLRLHQLRQFKLRAGHCCVPYNFAENLALARWVKRQRCQYKATMEEQALKLEQGSAYECSSAAKSRSAMTMDRIQMLEDIDFVWDSQRASWYERLDELKAYKQVHGHSNVPCFYRENPQLATWVKCQRRQYKLYTQDKQSNMSPERLDALNNMGFEWEVRANGATTPSRRHF